MVENNKSKEIIYQFWNKWDFDFKLKYYPGKFMRYNLLVLILDGIKKNVNKKGSQNDLLRKKFQ